MERLPLKRGNLIVYIILLIAATGLLRLSGCTNNSGNGDDNMNLRSRTLRVAIEVSPIGVATNADTLGGFYYDMIREIAANENLSIEIDGFTQISDALKKLTDGKYDLVIADIPVTNDLLDKFIFTEPIYADREVLVQLKDSVTGVPPIANQSELRGDTVWLSAHSPFLTRIRNLSHELGDTIYVVQDKEYGPEQMMLMTALGEIKNVVVNEQVAKSIASDYPRLDLSLSLSFNQFQSWAVAPADSVLRDSLNVFIHRFKESPRFNTLLDRYFNEHPNVIRGR